ncbi:hypothetical protein [Streptomyces purpurascens]|uniref:hypothetical protein n=1 Tax=Streptomyces purpurascens TaxID=1924 RepID=UPI00167AD50B|nr:hypothetical protein [Streptomyces purpurascens]MCE7048112.1 hypothetical protein [Streptomyces purpurascens]GHA29493.1 hypothetical protein GCM10010303_45140 [Streptomyces purpurascens]
MTTMIDLTPIIKDHFNSLRSHSTGKMMWMQVAFFYGPPVLLASGGCALNWKIGGVDNILAAFAILTGLLFNLLVLLFDVAAKATAGVGGTTDQNTRLKLAKELQANVTYTLLVALAATTILGICAGMDIEKLNRWIGAAVLLLLSHFMLTLLMILKRIRSAFLNSLT